MSDVVSATHWVGSSRVRRACHEPLWVKAARRRLRTCLHEVRRVEIGNDLLRALKITRKSKEKLAMAARCIRGGKVWVARKPLTAVAGFRQAGSIVYDPSVCAVLVDAEFRKRWGVPPAEWDEENAAVRQLATSRVPRLRVQPGALDMAVDRIKNSDKIDKHGACVAALRMAGWVRRARDVVEEALNSDVFWQSVVLTGTIGNKGKRSRGQRPRET